MKSQWKFRVVLKKRSFIVKHNGNLRIFEGNDKEVLEFAAKIHEHFENRGDVVERVEARSIGSVELGAQDDPDRRLVYNLHRHGNVWQFEPHRHVAAAKDTNLDWLINLAAIRSRGYVCEIQIFVANETLKEAVLINANDDPVD